jgi:hypothetical protein
VTGLVLPDAVADPAAFVLAVADPREKRIGLAHPVVDSDDDIGWWVDDDQNCLEPTDDREPLIRGGDNEIIGSVPTLPAADHIAAEANPAHALAEVALWRGIAERHQRVPFGFCEVGDHRTDWPCPDLLAVVAAARAYLGEQT